MKFILFLALVIVVLAWAPWMTAQKAEFAVKETFEADWKDTTDGCSVQSIENIRDVKFGYKMDVLYLCGLVDSGEQPQRAVAMVTPIYTVHWLEGYDKADEQISQYFRDN